MPIRIALLALLIWPYPALALSSVTVMADNNLSVAMAEIARSYSRDRGVIVNTSFAPAKSQEAQITEGDSGDILITPDLKWIENLKTQGLVDIYSQTQLARDRLALVGPLSSPLHARLLQNFPVTQIIEHLGGEQGFVIGNPETLPEGVYSKEALRKLNVAADLEPYTLFIKNREQMFDIVITQKAYGLFFYTTAVGQAGVRVIDMLPEDSYTPIWYYAVVIAGDNMNEARRFLDYLKSTKTKNILKKNGFLTN
jgi:molybdate transport system substrate-binding protein